MVGDAADEVGADHQHALRAAGLDLGRGERDGRQERGAGGADVDRAGALRAERVGDQRRRVRRHLVLRHRRDQHEVEIAAPAIPARSSASSAGGGGEVGEALVVARHAALADAGAGVDPVVGLADPLGDRVVVDDRLRQHGGDRAQRGAARDGSPAARASPAGWAACSGIGRLQLVGRLRLDVGQGAAHEAGQDLAGRGLDEAGRAALVAARRASRASGPAA